MKKLLNKKGFTLMEMLIVVAIIVILVAISIPAFSGSLDSAKQAADAANFRAAKAALVMQTLAGADAADKLTLNNNGNNEPYYYDFAEGKFVAYTAPGADGTGGTNVSGSMGECSKHSDNYITIKDGKVVWSDGSSDCE